MTQLAPLLIAAAGLVGGVVALLRIRPESGKLVVEAAEGAVVVQSGVITTLREELGGMRDDLDEELKRRLKCETRLDELEEELELLRIRLKAAGVIDGPEPAHRPRRPPPSRPST